MVAFIVLRSGRRFPINLSEPDVDIMDAMYAAVYLQSRGDPAEYFLLDIEARHSLDVCAVGHYDSPWITERPYGPGFAGSFQGIPMRLLEDGLREISIGR
jgi:hypothetical protein